MHPQPPLDGADSFVDPGELNTDNCFSTDTLAHFGQSIFSCVESTIVSNRWLQRRQVYSKIGINWFSSGVPQLGFLGFGGLTVDIVSDRLEGGDFQAITAQSHQVLFVVTQQAHFADTQVS